MTTSDMLDYYNLGQEENRLVRSLGRLEQIRTWEIMHRYLPPPPARVLDVGGGTGVYALPLAARGYRVHLIDPVPLHVERARFLSDASETPLVAATVGDARRLEVPDASFEVVLLLGPLYHLIVRDERIAALAEARRALAPGGLLLSAYISRFASACDGIQEGALRDAAFAAIVEADLTDGIHRNPTNRPEWFTTAYFHRPEEIGPEIEKAGLFFESLIAVEGPMRRSAGACWRSCAAWKQSQASSEPARTCSPWPAPDIDTWTARSMLLHSDVRPSSSRPLLTFDRNRVTLPLV